jgi:hypothetical protein
MPRSPSPSELLGLGLVLAAALVGCGGEDAPAAAAAPDGPPARLSTWGLFEADGSPKPELVYYDVAAALWADNAEKERWILLPEGEQAVFDAGEDWQFPLGTIIVKRFAFPLDFGDPNSPTRELETRLLVYEDEVKGWTPLTYVRDEALGDSVLEIAGKRIPVQYVDALGAAQTEDYLVPNSNQCGNCHERSDRITFLGPFTQQLNRVVDVDGSPRDQLAYLAERGLFSSSIPASETLPAFADPFGDGPLEDRARAYLHANCSTAIVRAAAAGRAGSCCSSGRPTPSTTASARAPWLPARAPAATPRTSCQATPSRASCPTACAPWTRRSRCPSCPIASPTPAAWSLSRRGSPG